MSNHDTTLRRIQILKESMSQIQDANVREKLFQKVTDIEMSVHTTKREMDEFKESLLDQYALELFQTHDTYGSDAGFFYYSIKDDGSV